MPKQTHIGGEPSIDELQSSIGYDVYVSPGMMEKDLKACEKLWREEVTSELGDGYTGEIRGFRAEGEPWATGDMRDTWSLCIVKDGKVVAYEHFSPWSRSTNEDDYENDTRLAEMVVNGEISLAEAKESSQRYSEHEAEDELQEELEAGMFSAKSMLKEAKE